MTNPKNHSNGEAKQLLNYEKSPKFLQNLKVH